MKKMVYIVISVTGILIAGFLFAGCGLSSRKNGPKDLTGVSLVQSHMEFSQCYSFYLREEEGKVLFDAQVRFEDYPYSIVLEGCQVDSSEFVNLRSMSEEYGVADYVAAYKKKPSLFTASDETTNKITVYWSDGSYKTADTDSEHIDVFYDYFFDLAKKYVDESISINER